MTTTAPSDPDATDGEGSLGDGGGEDGTAHGSGGEADGSGGEADGSRGEADDGASGETAPADARDASGVTVAVAHYPEGAGHATRMLAVGQAFEARGADIMLAGGGPGTQFLAANGYTCDEPTVVDYIDDFQDGGNLLRVVTRSVPRSGKRVLDFVRWLRREDPTLLVTDDMFAAMAAPIARTPLYFVTHNAPGFYDERVETVFTDLLTRLQRRFSNTFFYPAVWDPHPVDPAGVERVPPIALDGSGGAVADATLDVLLVPSHYSRDFPALEERIEAAGHDVLRVGSDDWDTAPSMLPYMRAADVVVCSGYSTIMEAAVAGTPCVIHPFTDEQRGVARVIRTNTDRGFAVVDSSAAVTSAVDDPPRAPAYENGTGVIADRVLVEQGRTDR